MKNLQILLYCCVSLFVPALSQGGELREDFSEMKNGNATAESKMSDNLGDRGARVNDWDSRSFSAWMLGDSAELAKKILRTFNTPVSWKAMGKRHKLDLEQSKGAELSIELIESLEPNTIWIWLSDDKQNGYGAIYTSRRQTVQVIKIHEGKLGFEPHRETPSWVRDDSVPVKLPEPVEQDTIVRLIFRIEQSAPDKAPVLTAWVDGDKVRRGGKASSPLVEWKDKGDGAGMTNGFAPAVKPAEASRVYSLKDLSHLAFGAEGTKETSAEIVSVQIKTLD